MSLTSVLICSHFVAYSFVSGSSNSDNSSMSLSNLRLKYWAPFINHELLVVPGIRWYIANLFVRHGLLSSVENVDYFHQSNPVSSYIINEANRIYQACYHDARYYTFQVMDSCFGNNSMRGMSGRILSYDHMCHQYEVIVNVIKHSSMEEVRCHLSPCVMKPVMILTNEKNWSTYHLSRKSKTSKRNIALLNLPEQILSMMPPNIDSQSVLIFRYDVFELLRRKFTRPDQAVNGAAVKVLMNELDRQEAYAKHGIDSDNLLEKHIMSLINECGSCDFSMPFIDPDKSLHKSGEGLYEFDVILKKTMTYQDLDNAIYNKFSKQEKLTFNRGSFQSLIPGQDIDDNVCDLCIDW